MRKVRSLVVGAGVLLGLATTAAFADPARNTIVAALERPGACKETRTLRAMTPRQTLVGCRCCGWTTETGNDGKSYQVCNHQCCD